jgi:hypothetical protein
VQQVGVPISLLGFASLTKTSAASSRTRFMNSSKPCKGRLISTRTKVESLSQRMKIRMLRRRLCIDGGFNEERWGGWRERNVQQSAPRSASQCYHTAIRQLFVSRNASFVSRRTDHGRSRTYLLQVFEDDVLWCMSEWSDALVC